MTKPKIGIHLYSIIGDISFTPYNTFLSLPVAFRYDEAISQRMPASSEEVFHMMLEFESYPEWQSAVSNARLIEQGDAGPVMEFHVDLIVRKLRYVLEYSIDHENRRLSWQYIEGDIEHVSGEFYVTEEPDGHCTAVYVLDVRPGFWLPKPLADFVKNTAMKGVLKDLHKKIVHASDKTNTRI